MNATLVTFGQPTWFSGFGSPSFAAQLSCTGPFTVFVDCHVRFAVVSRNRRGVKMWVQLTAAPIAAIGRYVTLASPPVVGAPTLLAVPMKYANRRLPFVLTNT